MIERARLAFLSEPEIGEFVLVIQFGRFQDDEEEILRFVLTAGQLANIISDGIPMLMRNIRI